MRKKFLSGSALLAIAAVAGWNVSINSQGDNLSDVSLANMEALAGENDSVSIPCLSESGTCTYNCTLADGTKATCTSYVKHS
jgi:hypothetical protein